MPIRSTGIGSWPGTDMADAIKISLAECPELPFLPELPARGEYAAMIGRSTALLAGLAVDLQPAGWRLTDGSGRDHRRAINTLRSDLDLVEEHAQGYAGPLKYAVAGPWTLAATMERPRGDRVLADYGARRDLAQSLAEGVAEMIMDMRRRLPEVQPIVQLDEPLLPSVLAGAVPTASGFSRHRVVDIAEVRGRSPTSSTGSHAAARRSWCTAARPMRRSPCSTRPAPAAYSLISTAHARTGTPSARAWRTGAGSGSAPCPPAYRSGRTRWPGAP